MRYHVFKKPSPGWAGAFIFWDIENCSLFLVNLIYSSRPFCNGIFIQ